MPIIASAGLTGATRARPFRDDHSDRIEIEVGSPVQQIKLRCGMEGRSTPMPRFAVLDDAPAENN
jgi:hypothetical protein